MNPGCIALDGAPGQLALLSACSRSCPALEGAWTQGAAGGDLHGDISDHPAHPSKAPRMPLADVVWCLQAGLAA